MVAKDFAFVCCVSGIVIVYIVCVHVCIAKWLGYQPDNRKFPGSIPSYTTLVLLLLP